MIQMHSRCNLKTYGLSPYITLFSERHKQKPSAGLAQAVLADSLLLPPGQKSLQLNFDTLSTTGCAFSATSLAFKRFTTSSACRQNDISKNNFILTTVLQTILSLWEVEYHTYRKENYMHVRSPHSKRSTHDHLAIYPTCF